jgi:hypothetical protein
MFKLAAISISLFFSVQSLAMVCIATRESETNPLDQELSPGVFDGVPFFETRMDNAYFLVTDASHVSGKIRFLITGSDHVNDKNPKNAVVVQFPAPTKKESRSAFFEYNELAYTLECKIN